MNGIKILCVGKIKEKYFSEGIRYYLRQIRTRYPAEILECPDEPTPDKASATEEDLIKRTEGKRILQKIQPEDYVVALSIDGMHYDTNSWRERMKKRSCQIRGSLVFVIGGSLGLSREVEQRADEKLSFSSMTFPHQMMRLILCEQLAGLDLTRG